jgi:hypothetical protein
VIDYTDDDPPPPPAFGPEQIDIPVVMVSRTTGELLKAAANVPEGVSDVSVDYAAHPLVKVALAMQSSTAHVAGALRSSRTKLHLECVEQGLDSYRCATLHKQQQEALPPPQEEGEQVRCSPQQYEEQQEYFAGHTGGEFSGEDAKLSSVLLLLHHLSPSPAGKVVLDVGCARGDFSHEVL